jgi:hypothetical protein
VTYRRQVRQPVNEHPGDADVLDVGGRWPWDGPRGQRAGLAAAALVAGLVAGYLAGHLQAAVPAKPRPAASVIIPAGETALADTGNRCAAQQGHGLQLGIEIENQSRRPVTLEHISPVLPLGGLRPVSSQAGSCGLLPGYGGRPVRSLAPGATGWLTVTFAVLIKCPQPIPVQFKVSYVQHGRSITASFDGFPDLGEVRYGNCGSG